MYHQYLYHYQPTQHYEKYIAEVSSGKRLVNSKYVIFVYVLCSHLQINNFFEKTIFFVKNKSKVDNSVFFCLVQLVQSL